MLQVEQHSLDSFREQRILISPLNWGMGHVTRTIPIIRKLLAQNNRIFIACNAEQKAIYEQESLGVVFIRLEGYPFKFSGSGNWEKELLNNLPSLLRFIRFENKQVEEFVSNYSISCVIADQRYGFFSKKVKSYIISHQLQLPVQRFKKIVQLWNFLLLKRFDEVWVPDDMALNLAGDLSRNKKLKSRCIGMQSRFLAKNKEGGNSGFDYKYMGIVSGPMPYALDFSKQLLSKLSRLSVLSIVVIPQTVANELNLKDYKYLKVLVQPSTPVFERFLSCSEVVISRAGYSTLMDLTALNKKAILIPTPGQYEQIYLAAHHQKHKNWRFYSAGEFESLAL